MAALTLGGVEFQGWELPEEVHLGGKHNLKVHKMPGGTRIIDAMGPDDDAIPWSGKFRGASALGRAQALDAMRRGGRQQSLSVLGMSYQVLIEKFEFRPQRGGIEVPYSINCEVLENGAGGGAISIASLDALVGGDMASAIGILAGAVGP